VSDTPSSPLPAVAPGDPVAGVGGTEFLEVVVLFLRTIPLYPDGHNRVLLVTERLQGVLQRNGAATEVVVTDTGLRVGERDVVPLAPGAKQFRDALAATGISSVRFQADAAAASYVSFARALQRNARLCQSGKLTFSDLWMSPISGIELEEMRFSRESFDEVEGELPEGAAPAPRSLRGRGAGPARGLSGAGGGSGGGTGGGSGGGTGSGTGGGSGSGAGGGTGRGRDAIASEGVASGGPKHAAVPPSVTGASGALPQEGGDQAEPSPTSGAASRPGSAPSAGPGSGLLSGSGQGHGVVYTVAKDVRDLALQDAEVLETLDSVQRALAGGKHAHPARVGDDGAADVLEHVLTLLPLEARLDPAKGLKATRRILTNFLKELARSEGQGDDDANDDHRRRAMLLRSVMAVFPHRRDGAKGFPLPDVTLAPEDVVVAPEDQALRPEDVLSQVPPEPPDGVPTLDPDTGIMDMCGVLTHALLIDEEPGRRKFLRTRLVEALRARPAIGLPPCLIDHLREECAKPPAQRDVDCIRLLAGIAEEAGIDGMPAAEGWLPLEAIVAVFPRLLRAFMRGGGSAGLVARQLGRDAVLGAAPALLGPGGPLEDSATVERILSERSCDMLPFAEVLVTTRDPIRRASVLSALRRVDMPVAAACALRIVPDDRVSEQMLRGVCEDGFARADSHRFDVEAVEGITSAVTDRSAHQDVRTRAYATASLAAFPRELTEAVLRSCLARRFFLPTQPREVRRAARLILSRFPKAPAPFKQKRSVRPVEGSR